MRQTTESPIVASRPPVERDSGPVTGGGPRAADWALAGVLGAISFACFCQGFDLPITARHSVALLDAIVRGQTLHYYSYVNDLALSGFYGEKSLTFAAVYPPVVYVTLAAWNLPLWALSRAGVAVSPLAYVMWDKVFVVIACMLCARALQRLAVRIDMPVPARRWVAFAFLTSPLVMFGAVMFAQIDALIVWLTLLGLMKYLDRRLHKFSLLIGLAVCFKALPILIFLPLLLLVEKRVLHLAKHTLIACGPAVLQRAVASIDPGFSIGQRVAAEAYGFAERVYANGLPTGFGTAFFFGLAMIGICAFAYGAEVDDERTLRRYLFYLPLAVCAFFFSFVRWHPQWLVMMVPYLVVCGLTSRKWRLATLLEIGFSAAYLAIACVYYYHNADQDMVNHALLPAVFGVTYDNSVLFAAVARQAGLPLALFVTVFVGCVLTALVAVFPGSPPVAGADPEVRPERGLMWARALVVLLYVVPTLGLFAAHALRHR